MMLNNLYSNNIESITPELKRITSNSSFKSPNNFEYEYEESILAENATIAESQPRILENIEGEIQNVEEIHDTKPAHSLSKKQIQCCSKRFGFIPFLSTLAIFMNVLFLIIIALCTIIPTKLSEDVPIKELLDSRVSVKYSFAYIRDTLELFSYSNNETFILELVNGAQFCYVLSETVSSYNQSVYQMVKLIPSSFEYIQFFGESNYVNFLMPLYQNWTEMAEIVCELRDYSSNETNSFFDEVFSKFNEKFKSQEFPSSMKLFEEKLNQLLEDIYQICFKIDEFVTYSGYVAMTLSCVSCFVIIPFGILVYLVLGRKLIRNEIQLKIESGNILKDTMADIGMRDEFKIFCRKMKMEFPFSILERIQHFKEMCKESIDQQLKLYEITKDFVMEKVSVKGNQIFIQQVSNELEKKLSHSERIKYEIIFEIIDTIEIECVHFRSFGRVIHQLDLYNNREGPYETIDIIHSKILDHLEREISDILSLTHFQFKSTHALNMNTSPNSPQSPSMEIPLI